MQIQLSYKIRKFEWGEGRIPTNWESIVAENAFD